MWVIVVWLSFTCHSPIYTQILIYPVSRSTLSALLCNCLSFQLFPGSAIVIVKVNSRYTNCILICTCFAGYHMNGFGILIESGCWQRYLEKSGDNAWQSLHLSHASRTMTRAWISSLDQTLVCIFAFCFFFPPFGKLKAHIHGLHLDSTLYSIVCIF